MSGLSVTAGDGGGDLTLLKLMADPDLFSQRIKQFESARAEAEAWVKKADIAQDILAARAKAETDRADATAALRIAQAKAEKIVADAEATARGMVAQAQETAAAVEKAATDKADMVERDCEKLLAEATAENAAAKKQHAENKKTDVDLKAKQKELVEAIAGANEAKALAVAERVKFEKKLAAITAAAGE